jgi:acid stress chaperone HdeA
MNRHSMRHFTVSALLCASTLAVAPAAFAAKTPQASAWKCKEFVVIEDQYQPRIFYWSDSHARSGSPDNPTVGVERSDQLVPIVMEDCRNQSAANPSQGASLSSEGHSNLSRNNLAQNERNDGHYLMGD